MKISTIDLGFQGVPETIASFLVEGPAGLVLMETGPGSTLDRLLAGLADHGASSADIQAVLVSHIHLDHAGAAGWWARQEVPIYVHAAGAPHLIDPGKLLSSAQRIYGDRMDRLWGETLSAPPEQVFAVEDGDRIRVAGLEFEAISTPGHARHHHVYRLGDVGFMGDSMGILLPGRDWIDLPAPPPEFDLEEWRTSLQRIRAEQFAVFYRTHFGEVDASDIQIDRFEDLLTSATDLVRQMMEEGLSRNEMVEKYQVVMRQRAATSGLDAGSAQAYELANPRDMSVDGIVRYWRKWSG